MLYTIGHYWAKSLQEAGFSLTRTGTFPQLTEDSLSKCLAAVVGQVSEVVLHRQNSALPWEQFYEDAHAFWHVWGKLARFLCSEAWGADRAWIGSRAGVRWLPAKCRAAAGMWHIRHPVRWDVNKQQAQHSFGVLIRHIPGDTKHCKEMLSYGKPARGPYHWARTTDSWRVSYATASVLLFDQLAHLLHSSSHLSSWPFRTWRIRNIALVLHYNLFYVVTVPDMAEI